VLNTAKSGLVDFGHDAKLMAGVLNQYSARRLCIYSLKFRSTR
jgi:hypothetical protein